MNRGGLAGAVAAEWTKLWSVRSTRWCLAAAAGLMAAMVAANGVAIRDQHAEGVPGREAASAVTLPGEAVVYLVQFALCALAALTVTSEYAHRSMPTTLQCTPVRWRVPVAKAVVVAVALFGAGIAMAAPAIWLADLALGGYGAPYSGADVVETVIAHGVYLALIGVLTVGIGTALRAVAGTLVTLFALLMVLPVGLIAAGSPVLRDLAHYVPGMAGIDLMERLDGPTGGPWGAAGVLVAWAAVALAAGTTVLRRRDA